ncbi:MAG: prolyl oligopeptidase family serine peptidase [Verrucomicrobiota bacterium]
MKATLVLSTLLAVHTVHAAPAPKPTPGDEMFAKYFRAETEKISQASLADVKSLADWQVKRQIYKRQLQEMLGLLPYPEKTDLHATITGRTEHEQFFVENLHYQSLPGLYVTANLYVPKGLTKPAPAILYVCGHGPVKRDGISYGNKVTYQHHGAWFARNGYVCLTIDTIQMGELEGYHHGTYRYDLWWWNSRGYTPAGVEAWNSIRGLDYLQSRKEVDPERLGVTGRSGGGAYSWWTAALDERVKAAVPVAGITDLHNHVVDGAVEGHCDCMFMVNTYRWDYAQVAALIAPRALLLSNSDKDRIFPLDGVMRVHFDVEKIYGLYKAATNYGVLITEGPHKDTQDLQVPAFRWFNRFLKGEDKPVAMVAEKFFEPQQLKVFSSLPRDQRTTNIHDTFVPMAKLPEIKSASQWTEQRQAWLAELQKKTFAAWPKDDAALDLKRAFEMERDGLRFRAYDFTSQENVRLRLYLLNRASVKQPAEIELRALDESEWAEWLGMLRAGFVLELPQELALAPNVKANEAGFAALREKLRDSHAVHAFIAPRGVGLTAPANDKRHITQLRRRFMLLGQTLDSMRVYDLRRAVDALRTRPNFQKAPIILSARGPMAVNALYAAVYADQVARVELTALPASHQNGPDYLNVLRVLDIPAVVALAAERVPVRLRETNAADWAYPAQVAAALGWDKERISIEASTAGR